MKNLLIFGVGLIGGSIALKVKKDAIFDRVIGVSRHNGRSLDDFVKKGMLDEIAVNVEEAISTANFIIIATPGCTNEKYSQKNLPLFKCRLPGNRCWQHKIRGYARCCRKSWR